MGTWKKLSGIKAAFFDVDGTLLSHVTNSEPASAIHAVKELKRRGIMPILATGRPTYMLDIIDTTPFEAAITINGQYCIAQDKVLYSCPISKHDIEIVVAQVKQGLYSCQFQELDCYYVSDRSQRVIDVEQFVNQHYEVRDISRALTHDVFQLNAYLYPGEEHLMFDQTHDLKYARWNDKFIDVMPCEGGKSKGARIMLEHFNLSADQVICFGDGGNDMGIFDVCAHSVAMGNAQDSIKDKSEFITRDIDDDGIYFACKQLGLI